MLLFGLKPQTYSNSRIKLSHKIGQGSFKMLNFVELKSSVDKEISKKVQNKNAYKNKSLLDSP